MCISGSTCTHSCIFCICRDMYTLASYVSLKLQSTWGNTVYNCVTSRTCNFKNNIQMLGFLTSHMRGSGSSIHCVFYHSSGCYAFFKSQSKVPTESTRHREHKKGGVRTSHLIHHENGITNVSQVGGFKHFARLWSSNSNCTHISGLHLLFQWHRTQVTSNLSHKQFFFSCN